MFGKVDYNKDIFWTLLKMDKRIIMIYSGHFLNWTREKLSQRTRKLIIMHEELHSSDDVYRLVVTRKLDGKGLTSIEKCEDVATQKYEKNIQTRAKS